MVQKVTVTEGEFAGWQTYDLHGTFDQVVGPFYFRPDADGRGSHHGDDTVGGSE